MYQNKFFSATSLCPGTWQITNCFNDHSRMNTYAYLLEGENRAMLIDTMFGYGNLRAFCRELTDKPLLLVNTHYHGDHAGGNYDFEACYIHAADMPYFYSVPEVAREEKFRQMQEAALPEHKGMLLPTDACVPRLMRAIPMLDGDVFDLGGRKIEVIHVPGHTPGEVVLLDRDARTAYFGDACNSNTLVMYPGHSSVEEYLESLHHFKTFQSAFDIGYGGHEVLQPSIIDEAIELCGRVLAGTDDHYPSNMFGTDCFYGAVRENKKRVDGKYFNIAYVNESVRKAKPAPRML